MHRETQLLLVIVFAFGTMPSSTSKAALAASEDTQTYVLFNNQQAMPVYAAGTIDEDVSYTFMQIPLPAETANSFPNLLNNINHAVVSFYDGRQPFLWGTQIWDVPAIPGGTSCLYLGLNQSDQVVGGCFRAYASWPYHVPPLVPFVWEPGMKLPQALKRLPGDHYSSAWDISNSGRVVGNSGRYAGDKEEQDGVVWSSPAATPVPLKALPGATVTSAFALTEGGIIVGFSGLGFVDQWGAFWSSANAEPVRLPRLGGVYAVPLSVNEDGLVVGESDDSDGSTHAVLWAEDNGNWVITKLAPGYPFSVAMSINNSGQIVGYLLTEQGEYHAVLWQPKAGGYEMMDLSAIVPGWFFDEAFSINDAGVIAVEGYRDDDPAMTFLPGLLLPKEQ